MCHYIAGPVEDVIVNQDQGQDLVEEIKMGILLRGEDQDGISIYLTHFLNFAKN